MIENIKDISGKWDLLCGFLGILESKMASINGSCSSDEETLTAVIQEWLKGEGHPASWRKLIHTLYLINEADIADKLMKHAEPDPGRYILHAYF